MKLVPNKLALRVYWPPQAEPVAVILSGDNGVKFGRFTRVGKVIGALQVAHAIPAHGEFFIEVYGTNDKGRLDTDLAYVRHHFTVHHGEIYMEGTSSL